jgi:hypothetical protein
MIQITSAARPLYGQMPLSGVRNLLNDSDDLEGAAWAYQAFGTGTIPTLTSGATDPNGGSTAYRLQANRGAGNTVGDESTFRQVVTGPANPHNATVSIWARSNTGSSQQVYFRNVSGAGGSLITVTTSWQRFSASGAAAVLNDAFQIGSRGTVNADNSVDILIWHPQFQESLTLADYQSRVNAATVTQDGIPSVPIALLDTTDDAFSWTLPAGTVHLFLAGEKGCYFDTVTHAGGLFTVGPTTWTGGPAGAIANLIGQRHYCIPVWRDTAFTQTEKQRLVQWAMARGCPHVWNPGADFVVNGTFDADTDWAKGLGWSIGSGVASVDGSQPGGTNLAQTLSLSPGLYFTQFAVTSFTAGAFFPRLIGTTNTDGANRTATGVYRDILAPTAAVTSIAMRATVTGIGSVDNFTLRALTPGASPT